MSSSGYRSSVMPTLFSLLSLSVAFSGPITAPVELLIGDATLTARDLDRISASHGVLGTRQSDGFYRLKLREGKDVAKTKKTLRASGVDFVFESSSTSVKTDSVHSVRNHIVFLKARNRLASHQPGQPVQDSKGTGFYAALEHWLRYRVGINGVIDHDEMARALKQREAMPPAVMGGGSAHAPYSIWSYVGPNNLASPYQVYNGIGPLSGRKNAIAADPSNANNLYVASSRGGIWKSTDAGVTWLPKSDSWPYPASSAVAVHPTDSNIVLAGTGDRVGPGVYAGGMMRSADGGNTWKQVGTSRMKTEVITKIIFHPTTPTIVVCCTGLSTVRTGGGMYRSTDSGQTWTETQALNGNADDMDIATNNNLYAVVTNGANTGLVGVSTDFGQTWGAVPVNPNVNSQPALHVACSLTDANTVYLLSIGDEKIYKTTNGGTSWTDITGNFPISAPFDPNYNWAQKTYDKWIGVGTNGTVDVLYVGLITIAQSVSGGAVWTDIAQSYAQTPPNYIHNDQHSFARSASDPTVVYFGGDGGLFRYSHAATPVLANFTSLNATFKETLLYAMGLHPTDLTYILAGAQDNSSPASRGNLANWSNLEGADGGWCGFDLANPNRHFVTGYQGFVFLRTTMTGAATQIGPTDKGNSWPGAFIQPTVFGGTGGSQIFIGGQDIRMWQSGTTWTTLKSFGGVVTTINTSPDDPKAMVAGTANGEIWSSLNPSNPGTWTRIDNSTFTGRPVGSLAIKPGTLINDKQVVLCGLQGTGPNHLWKTDDQFGFPPVWTNVSGNLPNTAINAVAFDPYNVNRWYVGTDIGCFMTSNGGTTWTNMAYLGLPNVQVNDLEVSKNKAYLYAATFGRGIWRIQISSIPAPFSITGTVRKVDDSPFAGVSVALKKWKEHQFSYANTFTQLIPDNNATGIESTIPITLNYPLSTGALYLNIVHPYRGDLRIELEAPDGQNWLVKDADNGDPNPNVIGTFEFGQFCKGITISGTWKLKVKDLAPSDIGTLVSWKVLPRAFAYVTQYSTVTDAQGAYVFANLEASKYYVIPSSPGKTWTPGYRIMNVGPTRTLQDFKANQ